MRIQHRIGKPREQVKSCANAEIDRLVIEAASEFNCSKSWVINVALAQFFGVEVEHYDQQREAERKARKARGGLRGRVVIMSHRRRKRA